MGKAFCAFTRRFWLICLLLAIILASGCGSTKDDFESQQIPSPELVAEESGGFNEADLQNRPQLARNLPAPAGINATVWAKLTAELERVLRTEALVANASAEGKGTVSKQFTTEHIVERTASAAPQDSASATRLSYDTETDIISWGHYCSGDYDQNGLVGISDLTPLGIHFGKQNTVVGEPFPADSAESVVDGDSNGVINIADVTPIGVNFGIRVIGYRVYSSPDIADWPEESDAPNGTGAELVTEVPLTEASEDPAQRRSFSLAGIEPPAEGQMLYWARPYDDSGEGTPSTPLLIEAGEIIDPPPANFLPIAVLLAAPFNGLAPLEVEFQAFSSVDIDGEIVKLEWDFDGPIDGEVWLDTGLLPFTSHLYEAPGDYLATLRVTDNEGAVDTDVFPIKVRTATPPGASMLPSAYRGDAVFHVVLDGSESGDVDGWIVDYSWDWDDDGIMDYSSGENPVADFYFYEPGHYWLSMQVTDNDGLKSIFRQDFRVDPGAKWRRNLVRRSHYFISVEDDNDRYTVMNNAIVEVNGKPGVFLEQDSYKIPNQSNDDRKFVCYTSALDAFGLQWIDPKQIHECQNTTLSTLSGIIIGGMPAVIINDDAQGGTPSVRKMLFARATSADGSSWAPVVDTGYDDSPGFNSTLALAAGKPAVLAVGDTRFYHAEDALGAEWAEAIDFQPLTFHNGVTAMIGNCPAYFTISSSSKRGTFLRAESEDGSQWPSLPVVIPEVFESHNGDFNLVDVQGHPAVTFFQTTFNEVMFVRANNPEGSSWSVPVRVAAWTDGSQVTNHSVAIIDGRPAVLYTDFLTKDPMFKIANDPFGQSWGQANTVSPGGDTVIIHSTTTLASVAGLPALLQGSTIDDPDSEYGQISTVDYITHY